MEKRAMHVTRTRSSAPAGAPARPAAHAPLTVRPRRSRGSVLPALILLALLGAGGYYGWKAWQRNEAAKREAARLAQIRYERAQAEENARQKKLDEEYRRRQEEREAKRKQALEERLKARKKLQDADALAQTNAEEVPLVPKGKTDAELMREEMAARQKALEAANEERKNPEAKPIDSFAGISFNEPLKGEACVYRGTIAQAGGSVADCGMTEAVFGPAPKTPYFTFTSRPVVWLTPVSRRPYRIELRRKRVGTVVTPAAPRPNVWHDPQALTVIKELKKAYPGKWFTLTPYFKNRPGCEFVSPHGMSTLRVGEIAEHLVVSVERDDIRAEAKREWDKAHAPDAPPVAGKDPIPALDSDRYPQGRKADYRGRKFKPDTPKSFCGLDFGRLPRSLTPVVTPRQGAKGFFLDYRRAKCPAFMGFDRGRGDIDPYRNGLYAIHLFSDGSDEGLTDRAYYEKVSAALAKRYQTEPEKKAETQGFAELVYRLGDVTLTFGKRAEGGFRLDAVHEALAEWARKKPATPRRKKSRAGK